VILDDDGLPDLITEITKVKDHIENIDFNNYQGVTLINPEDSQDGETNDENQEEKKVTKPTK